MISMFPELVQFVLSDASLLKESENEFLWYIIIVLYHTLKDCNRLPSNISIDQLVENEEFNWHLIERSKERKFRERITPFFDNYLEIDLLAFIEDALAETDDDWVSREGRELMFIKAKSTLDTFIGLEQHLSE